MYCFLDLVVILQLPSIIPLSSQSMQQLVWTGFNKILNINLFIPFKTPNNVCQTSQKSSFAYLSEELFNFVLNYSSRPKLRVKEKSLLDRPLEIQYWLIGQTGSYVAVRIRDFCILMVKSTINTKYRVF